MKRVIISTFIIFLCCSLMRQATAIASLPSLLTFPFTGSHLLQDSITETYYGFSNPGNSYLPLNQSAATAKSGGDDNEIHIGLNYTYNSTWIMVQNTYGQFGKRRLAYTDDFGSAYGLMAGYDFKRKFGIQLGYVINSQEGQTYHDVLSGVTYDRNVSIQYAHIPLLFKWKNYLSDTKHPIIFNVCAGPQFGILKSSNDNVNGINTNITDRMNKTELSFELNFESDFYLTDFLYFTLGFNSSISNNINAQAWPAPYHDGKSRNLLFGVNLGLSYYFTNK